jgi:heme-degrading monooxygenase HmoA
MGPRTEAAPANPIDPTGTQAMVTIGMNYRVLPGKESQFENAFRDVLRVMAEMPGHKESRLFREVGEENHYLISSDWSEEKAFTAFMRSEEFAKVVNWGKEQILAGRPSHKVYRHGD